MYTESPIGRRPEPKKHDDNLRPEGDFYAPKPGEAPRGERAPIQRHPDNLTVQWAEEFLYNFLN